MLCDINHTKACFCLQKVVSILNDWTVVLYDKTGPTPWGDIGGGRCRRVSMLELFRYLCGGNASGWSARWLQPALTIQCCLYMIKLNSIHYGGSVLSKFTWLKMLTDLFETSCRQLFGQLFGLNLLHSVVTKTKWHHPHLCWSSINQFLTMLFSRFLRKKGDLRH